MNFERNLKNILYKLFSKNNFNYVFGLLLITIFIIILYKNNNLIEGNIVKKASRNINHDARSGAQNASDTQNSIQSTNKKSSVTVTNSTTSNGNTIPDTEDNMNCSSNNHFNIDGQNSASSLVSNACLQGKRLKQENNV
jgi:hypothetical protein